MFYNALARKGKLLDHDNEDDAVASSSSAKEDEATIAAEMESVVALHNNMNEKTWRKILQWEQVVVGTTGSSSSSPKLLRFQGRPTDLSPKAAVKHYLLGHPLPYDRHDWVIERSDGSAVRYVIDYYYDESRARTDRASARPDLHDDSGADSLLVDVRPALDGPGALFQRAMAMPYAQHVSHSTAWQHLPWFPTASMQSQRPESVQVWKNIQAAAASNKNEMARDNTLRHDNESIAGTKHQDPSLAMNEAEAKTLAHEFANLMTQCRAQQVALDECETDADCMRSNIDLTICMARRLCPVQQEALVQRLGSEDTDDDEIAQALSVVQTCLAHQAQKHASAKKQFPKVFSS